MSRAGALARSLPGRLRGALRPDPRAIRSWGLLWAADRRLAWATIGWAAATIAFPSLVVVALGFVVGAVPGAVEHGIGSSDGTTLIATLLVAAVVYGLSLMLDPVGEAIGTAVRSRLTGDLQGRLLRAVSGPVGIEHLEDPETLDRLADAEGSLTGYFPGDVPVTWAGNVAGRLSGVVGCAFVAAYVWWLGLLMLVVWLAVRRLMLAPVAAQAFQMRGQTRSIRRAWYLAAVGSKVRDAKEVRVFGLGDFAAAAFATEYRKTIDAGEPGLRRIHQRAAAALVGVTVVYGLALALLAHSASTGALDLRRLAILLPMLAVTAAAGSVSVEDLTLSATFAAVPDADRLEEDLAGQAAALAGGGDPAGLPRRAVCFRGVRFRYPEGDGEVLAGIDLELEAGTSTAIVGVNGAGKSTLVSLLGRLRDPTGGVIEVDGTDLRELDPAGWQRNVALMPQDPARFPVSAYENVAWGSIEHTGDREGVEAAAALAGFDEVLPRLPHGWDTLLSTELPDGVDLSGGQWQRLALARALFATRHGASLLVLDEPTAALDVRSEARFYARFFEITAGLTTVVVSHRFATVRRAHQIAVLDDGVVAERGSHDELVAADGTYAHIYGLQAERFAA
jgi:ATP-binding cassette, subfamily B, bacterial